MLTEKCKKTEVKQGVRMCENRQDRAELPGGFTEKQSEPSIIEARQQLPSGLTHKESVLRAVSGFFSDSKKHRRTSRGQVNREKCLFSVKTRETT